jgi:hypothetical protein
LEGQPEQYEGYKRELLGYLRRELLRDSNQQPYFPKNSGYDIKIEGVQVEAYDEHEDTVVVLFREASRPGCLFGFRATAVGPSEAGAGAYSDPEGWALVILANFDESLMAANRGLPDECDPNGVTWV